MHNKPRIFINMHYMEIGGAERALLGMLNAIDTSKYDVDLFINQHTGEFMSLIPSNINLLDEEPRYSTLERPIIETIKKGHIDIAIARVIARLKHWVYTKTDKTDKAKDISIFQYAAKSTTPLLPKLDKLGMYDLAISFLTPHNIVKDKVQARKKIAWIHTDYSTVSVNAKQEYKVWSAFDNIISISDKVTDTFSSCFPELGNKIIEIENILSPKFIRQQASEFKPPEYIPGKLNFCSVGRFCHAKNFESIPFIAKILIDKGLDFHWFIIGYGNTQEIERNMTETQTHQHITLLGKKTNPYPYIANCDIYIQPSRYEGKSITVREAQILCRPTVITNYPTATSQVKDCIDGIICDMNCESVASAIENLARNQKLRESLTDYLNANDYGNESEINKIYNLI